MFLCCRSLGRLQTVLRTTSNALSPTSRCHYATTTTTPPKLKKKLKRKKPDPTLLNVLAQISEKDLDKAASIDSQDPIATPIEPPKSKRQWKREKLPAKSKSTPPAPKPKTELKREKLPAKPKTTTPKPKTELKREKRKEITTDPHYPIAYTRRVEGLIEPLKKPVLTGQLHITVCSSAIYCEH